MNSQSWQLVTIFVRRFLSLYMKTFSPFDTKVWNLFKQNEHPFIFIYRLTFNIDNCLVTNGLGMFETTRYIGNREDSKDIYTYHRVLSMCEGAGACCQITAWIYCGPRKFHGVKVVPRQTATGQSRPIVWDGQNWWYSDILEGSHDEYISPPLWNFIFYNCMLSDVGILFPGRKHNLKWRPLYMLAKIAGGLSNLSATIGWRVS